MAVFLFAALLDQVGGQGNETAPPRVCLRTTCREKSGEGGLSGIDAYESLQRASPDQRKSPNAFPRKGRKLKANTKKGRKRRDAPAVPPPTTYQLPNRIIEQRRILVEPAPGQPPVGVPLVGAPGGGAFPDTDPYIKNMAPEGTVPIAIFPPFEEELRYPTKCVVYSELTDFELLPNEVEPEAAPPVTSLINS